MTSSLTVIIEDNPDCTLREFALQCADAGPLRRFGGPTPADYYIDKIIEYSGSLGGWVAATDAELCARMWEERREEVAYVEASKLRQAEKTARYARMRARVVAWEAPEELLALKAYMLEQIDQSTAYVHRPEVTPQVTVQEYRERNILWIKQDIEHATLRHTEELQWTQRARLLATKLNGSLP